MEITAPKPTAVPLALPFRTRLKLSIISAITDAATRTDGSINRRLLNFFDFFINVAPNPNPVNGVKSIDITVDHSRNLWFRLYIPTRSTTVDRLPLIVFFHGGGFVFLSAATFSYDAVIPRLARKLPAVVVSVNYRLAPEHRCPAMYQDGFDVLKFLDEDESFRKLLPGNVDLSRCFLAGDSAGGNLAHHVAVKACQLRFQHIKVTGIVAIQPFFGGEERTESEMRLYGTPLVSVKRINWMWNAFLPPGEGYNRDHNYINVSGPNATDLSSLDFPATLVVIAGYDMLQDWQRRYYKWLKNSGKEVCLVEYPSMCHAFYIFPELPQSAKLIADVGNFIRKCSKD